MKSSITLDASAAGSILSDAASKLGQSACDYLGEISQGTCLGGENCGWFDWPKVSGLALWDEITTYRDGLGFHFDTVVVCGIGGSYAGTKAIAGALSQSIGSTRDRKELLFAGHHLSERYLIELLDYLEHKKPILVAISKSGTTIEPAIGFRVLSQYMNRRFGSEATDRIVVVTDENEGALRSLAQERGYHAFPVPSHTGGRFSALTAVGLVPLALAGFNGRDILVGANEMYASLADADGSEHPALVLASLRQAAWQAGYRIDALAYSEPRLAGLSEWWKQLYGESEGKAERGLFPVGLAYSTDLHSLGQYLQEGCPSLLETFLFVDDPVSKDGSPIESRLRVPGGDRLDGLGYLEETFVSDVDRAAMESALKAHSERGVPCLRLSIPRLDAYFVGQLIAFFQTSCAISALLLGVNPFNQPGVEGYKQHLFRLMGKPGAH